MPEVLAERLGLGHPDLSPPAGAPLRLAFEVLVDPVLPQQPVALAGVAGEHLPLDGEDARDVDDGNRPVLGRPSRSVPSIGSTK